MCSVRRIRYGERSLYPKWFCGFDKMDSQKNNWSLCISQYFSINYSLQRHWKKRNFSKKRSRCGDELVIHKTQKTWISLKFRSLCLRRERDSNPRTAHTVNGFQDRRVRPLCHLSKRGDKSRTFFLTTKAFLHNYGKIFFQKNLVEGLFFWIIFRNLVSY